MRMVWLWLLGALALSSAAFAQPVPPGELPDIARPLAYRLDLVVDPAEPRFRGRVEIDIVTTAPAATLYLHGSGLTVSRAEAVTGRMAVNAARYAQVLPSGVARLDFARPLAAGRHTLRFTYDAPFQDGASGLYRAKVGDDWYAWTQMEAIDARRMFPSFDEPRHKTPFSVTITADASLKAFANAPVAKQEIVTHLGRNNNSAVVTTFATTKPLPTYLVAIAVGPFDIVETVIPPNAVRRTPLAMRHIATRGQAARLAYAARETPRILALLETYFGTPYPYEKLDQIASPTHGGAMENAGLIVYDDTLLLLDDDAPVNQLRNFGVVVAHELAHQWFGNLVTPRWWDDIWLNESFADWMGNRTAQAWRSDLGVDRVQAAGALDAMAGDSRAVGRPVRQPIVRNEDIMSAFDSITYAKGGQVLEMIEGYLGPDVFQRGVRRHLARYAGGTATSDQFFESIAAEAKNPQLVAAFRSFVDQEGVPLVTLTPAQNGGYGLVQTRYRPIGVSRADQRWIVPVCARSGEGRRCALLAEATGALPPVVGTTAWIVPNAGAAGYYRFDLDAAGWDRLIAATPGLPADEAMAVADSLTAGFLAGRVPAARLIAAARVFATHADRLVATRAPAELASLAPRFMTEADRAALARLMRALYGERLRGMGLDLSRGAYAAEPADRRELRVTLARFVADHGRDAAARAALVAAAEAAVAGDAAALDPAFRRLAFGLAVRDRGRQFMARLHAALLVSQDPLFRGQAALGLGAADTPDLARAALAYVEDARLQGLERLDIGFGLLNAPATRDLALEHIDRNFDTYRALAGSFAGAQLMSTGSAYCAEADAVRVERTLRPRLATVGGELDLRRSLAGIRECAELARAKAAEMSAALASAAR